MSFTSWFGNFKNSSRKFYSWLAIFLSCVFTILLVDNFRITWVVLLFLSVSFLIFVGEFKKIIFLLILLLFFLVSYWLMFPKIANSSVSFESKVVDKVSFGNFVKFENDKIFIRGNQYEIGTLLKLSGKLVRPKNTSDFDFVSYLKSKGSFLVLENAKITFLEESNTIFAKVRKFFSIQENYSKKLIPMIFLAETPVDASEFRKILVNLGVYQIFVVSGFHINLFKQLFFSFSKMLKIRQFIYKPLFFCFLTFQLFLFNFSISFLRGFLFWGLIEVNKLFLNKKFNKIELLSMSGILILSINPLIFYSVGFVLTFTISFIITIINQINFPKNWHKVVVNFLFINFFSSIFSTFLNSYYNFMAPINTIVFTGFFTFLYASLLIFVFNPQIVEWISKFFIQSVGYIQEFQILTLNIQSSLAFLIISCIISLVCFSSLEATISLSKKKFSDSQKLKTHY
ncbi:MAG0480 family ComEC-like protein [Mesomycoplasma ovipneumoniae]|uniref:MAG0480 family ComEC-like protein n=1 Tax=Mesomycoplasma ovipneumoniae TaxID=29562 RepID=UPI003080B48B